MKIKTWFVPIIVTTVFSLLFFFSCNKDDETANKTPSTPSNLSAEVMGNSIRVSWNSVSNADNYLVFKSITDGNYTFYQNTKNAYFYDNEPSENNYYKVKAENGFGQSSFSSSVYCHYTPTPNGGGNNPTFTVNVSANPSSGGTVDGGGEYLQGQSCTIQASANNGYSFTNWTENGNVVTYDANYTFNVTGNRSFVANFTNTTPTYLPAPTGLSSSVSGSSIKVAWNSVSGANGYKIYRASATGSYAFYKIDDINDYTSYYDDDPYPHDNYYKVQAVYRGNATIESELSDYTYCDFSNGGGGGSNTAPSAPTGVSAEVSGSRIKISWNSVSNATEYEIYWSEDDDYYNSIGSTSNTYIYDEYPYEDNYYKVIAKNSYGNSPFSSSAYCYYSSGGGGGGGSVPSAPTGVSAVVSGSRIEISWNSVSNATRYEIYRSNNGSNYNYFGSTSNTYNYDSNPYEDNYYKVKAINSYGESSFSSPAYCHYSSGGGGGGTNYEPCPPTVSASGTSSSITVSWTVSTNSGCGTPTKYEVYKRNPHTASFEYLAETTSKTYRDSNVHPGINRYAVKAINSYGSSGAGYGNSSSITLQKPSSFTAEKYLNSYIRCNWSKVSQATGYQIFMSSSANGTYYIQEEIQNVNTTSFDIYYPASSGTKVYVKMRAMFRADYGGDPVYSDFTTYKSVTF